MISERDPDSEFDSAVDASRDALVALALMLIECQPTYVGDDSGLTKAANLYEERLQRAGMTVRRPHLERYRLERDPRWVDARDYLPDLPTTHSVAPVHGRLVIDPALPTLALGGHLDVEPLDLPDWNDPAQASGAVDSGYLFGRGASDMLAAMACFVTALEVVQRSGRLAWNVEIHAVPAEELGGNGTLELLLCEGAPDFVVLGEPSSLQVNSATLGFHHFRISVLGRRAHMATVQDGASDLIIEVMQALQALRGKMQRLIASYDDFSQYAGTPLTVGMLQGGSDPAVPPAAITLEGVIFTPGDLGSASVAHMMNETFAHLPPGRISVSFGSLSFPGNFASNATEFSDLVASCGEGVGTEQTNGAFLSPCDLRLYRDFGANGVVFGPGHLEDAHAPDEKVAVESLLRYTKAICRLLSRPIGAKTD